LTLGSLGSLLFSSSFNASPSAAGGAARLGGRPRLGWGAAAADSSVVVVAGMRAADTLAKAACTVALGIIGAPGADAAAPVLALAAAKAATAAAAAADDLRADASAGFLSSNSWASQAKGRDALCLKSFLPNTLTDAAAAAATAAAAAVAAAEAVVVVVVVVGLGAEGAVEEVEEGMVPDEGAAGNDDAAAVFVGEVTGADMIDRSVGSEVSS
jgi:hypothetical protein